MTDIKEFLEKYGRGVGQGIRPNQSGSHPTSYSFTEADIATWNQIYQRLLKSDLNTLIRTERGSIRRCRNNRYAWDVTVDRNQGARLTVCIDGLIFCYEMARPAKSKSMRGWQAFRRFFKLCRDAGINLNDYAIDNGAEVKKEIDAPKIHMTHLNEELENVHHIDFHNSYPAGLCNTHPEFRKVIEPLYLNRKLKPENKDILNYTIGFMQSIKGCRAKWAHLSKDAIHDNSVRILTLSLNLIGAGRTIIGYNTDGIWYQGEVYHSTRNGEGPNLGQWQNDHINCKFRAKSHGAYEFIENGEYHPVLRGVSSYEQIKPREQWQWGDIYKESVYKYTFKEGEGIVKYEGDAQ